MQPVLDWPGDGGGQRDDGRAGVVVGDARRCPAATLLPALLVPAENAATVPVATHSADDAEDDERAQDGARAPHGALPVRAGAQLERDLVGATFGARAGACGAATR